MLQSQYSLSWDLYKSNICSGFCTLQQNEEFVDMTLAAEGHFVKVHQMMIALASPYLKGLITSAPCQHPIIFLNNVSHKVLCLLLEYIYRGEVVVPADCLPSFTQAAKALHIKGLESIEANALPKSMSHLDEIQSSLYPVKKESGFGSSTTDNIDQISESNKKSEVFIHCGTTISKRVHDGTCQTTSKEEDKNIADRSDELSKSMDDSNIHDSDDDVEFIEIHDTKKDRHINKSNVQPSSKLQYTVSIRGSLQIILNRYIYNLYSTKQSGLRRWRCVNYKNIKCSAYIITKGNMVVGRTHMHNHSFHDKKILSKIEKKAVYSAIEEVESCKNKQILNE